MNKPIYMDYQATTPTDPRVVELMLPYFYSKFGNVHSRSHMYGWDAEKAVEHARAQIAEAIGAADPKDVIFTSGATESNNLAIKGVARFHKEQRGNHIIVLNIEHKCVLEACRSLESEGFEISYVPVAQNGIVDPEAIRNAITSKTVLVTIMGVNNEIGVIQPIKEIGIICRERGIHFHTDCAQALGKIDLDVEDMNIDLMSISSHKIYGPQGVGALYVRRKNPRVRLKPLISGGGQERGLRSGTVPLPLVVGFGQAAEIAKLEMHSECERIRGFYNYFVDEILGNMSHVYLNGDREKRVPHNINMSFAAVEGESLMMAINNLAVSSGSACTSASLEPSYVLRGLGVSEDLAHSSIRFGFGRFTTKDEVVFAAASVRKAIERLRDISPLWDMIQEGIDLNTVEWHGH